MTNSVASTLADQFSTQDPDITSIRLRCPNCQKPLLRNASCARPTCSSCGFVMAEESGIFRALSQEREQYFRQFMREYETVRAQEGRGSCSSEFYCALPYQDLSGRNAWQWQIRAKTFRCLEQRILPEIERTHRNGCDVLDVGAGNGWFSYRMAQRGHRPVAVDLLNNDSDGLGAARHYFPRLKNAFPLFLAEMDCLPFESAQFDLIVFNASFHYSVDYVRTIGEALRCLRRPGTLVIADTAFYAREESGQAMLAERRASFQKQFGFASDSIPSLEYLTPARLKKLEETFSLRWNVLTPSYGLKWAMRPWKARLLRRREPSQFHLFSANVPHR